MYSLATMVQLLLIGPNKISLTDIIEGLMSASILLKLKYCPLLLLILYLTSTIINLIEGLIIGGVSNKFSKNLEDDIL